MSVISICNVRISNQKKNGEANVIELYGRGRDHSIICRIEIEYFT